MMAVGSHNMNGRTSMKRWLTILLFASISLIQPSSTFAIGFGDTVSNIAWHVFSKVVPSGSAFEKGQAMDHLSVDKDGDGYYAFGQYAFNKKTPGGRHWNRVNFWFPSKSYHHEMTTTLEGDHISPEQLIADLKREAEEKGDIEIAFWWDHQDAMLEDAIRDFVRAVGTDNFAISLIYSTSTHNISFYVNVDSGASHDTIHNTKLIRVLKDNIRRVLPADPDAYPKDGHEIRDHFTVSFGKPLIVAYLLGTGNLHFH